MAFGRKHSRKMTCDFGPSAAILIPLPIEGLTNDSTCITIKPLEYYECL